MGPQRFQGAGTCSQYNCGVYKLGRDCQCNDKCNKYRDCCTDYVEICFNGDTHDEEPTPSISVTSSTSVRSSTSVTPTTSAISHADRHQGSTNLKTLYHET